MGEKGETIFYVELHFCVILTIRHLKENKSASVVGTKS